MSIFPRTLRTPRSLYIQAPIFCAAIGQYPSAEHPPGEHDGFVIITADSASGMVDIHDRRPVTFSPKLDCEWLDPPTPKESAEQMVLHQGEQTESVEWFRVDKAVSNVRNQGCWNAEADR